MLLIDDLLRAPFRGLLFVLREIEAAARAERLAERGRILERLATLNRDFEEGRLTETAFEAEEQALLGRLESVSEAEASVSEAEASVSEAEASVSEAEASVSGAEASDGGRGSAA